MQTLYILWMAGAFDENKRPPHPPTEAGEAMLTAYTLYMFMLFMFWAFGELERASQ